jgi:membrane-bound lytic murein transglycosylase D
MKPGSFVVGKAGAIHGRVRFTSLVLFAAVLCAVSLRFASSAAAAPSDFPRPAKLAPAVEFWKQIFATYSQHQVVVHDDWYLGKVYEVLDFRPWYSDGEPETAEMAELRRAKIAESKDRVRAILLRLHALGPDPDASLLSDEERRVQALFADVSGSDKYLTASERVRGQSGLRERFVRGVAEQSRYLARMQAILRTDGVPVELARLPLVESCFDVKAYSKVGAAGVWQFMPSTGRQYMRVANDVDERRDPIRATHAAARHLSSDYDALGTWPLAITAYNHGRGGIARAVRETGTNDIGDIATRYRGKAFGFASRNFYAEFLAVVEITENMERHLGEVPTLPPLQAVEVDIERPIHLAVAARRIGVSTDELIELNPALMSPVTDGRAMVPRGYVLRVPGSAADSPVQIASALRAAGTEEVRTASASARPTTRTTSVAKASSGRAVAAAKQSTAKVTKVASRSTRPSAKVPEKQVVVHKVTAGQTLAAIARRYGTTVAMLQGMKSPRGNT